MIAAREAEHIVNVLGGKKAADGWMVHCPAHDDKTPSLHVSVSADKVLVKCFAGCDQERVLEGLRERRLWPEATETAAPPIPVHVLRYWYRDAAGRAIAYKERHDPPRGKKFCVWFRPNGDKDLGGAHPLLYRLERVTPAPKTDRIFVVEGEKCVEACERIGLLAVCAPNGSNGWRTEYSGALAGHPIVVLPDNDEPGRKHGHDAAESLKKSAAWLKYVELPGLNETEDIADWLRAGGTADALNALVIAAPYYGPPTVPRLITVPSMLDVQEEDVEWLWYPYIPKGKLTLMEGDPGSGKTYLHCAIGTAVTLGAPLPGELPESREPGKVLLMCGEDGYGDTIKKRLQAMGADQSRVRPVLGLWAQGTEQAMMLSPEGIIALEMEVAEYRPQMVVIDPMIAYLDSHVDINRSNEVRGVLRPVGDIAQRYGVAIIGVRHLTKAMHGMALYRGQGSIDFTAISRSVLLVGVDPDDPTRRIVVPSKSSLAEDGVARTFRIGKSAGDAEFLWEGDFQGMTSSRLLTSVEQGGDDRSSLDEAKDFLTELLFDEPMLALELLREAKQVGIAEKTLRRAKEMLNVKSIRKHPEGQPNGRGSWYWEMPLQPESKMAKPEEKASASNDHLTVGHLTFPAENGVRTPNSEGESDPKPPRWPSEPLTSGDDHLKDSEPKLPWWNDDDKEVF